MKTKSIRLPYYLAFRQYGASMVELLVALVLSLILVAGVGQIYLGSKQTYRMQDGQSRLQENARAALDILTRDIRTAGYLGCRSTLARLEGKACPLGYTLIGSSWCQPSPITIANPSSGNVSTLAPGSGTPPTPVISGGDNAEGLPARFDNPSPALSTSLTTGVVRGTDAITLLFGQSCGGTTSTALSSVDPADAGLSVDNTCIAETPATPLLIDDCQTAHIFKAATDDKRNTRNGIPTAVLGKTYKAGSEILLYRAYTYYIRFNPSNEPALYRFDNNRNTSDEVVEGIENMQIQYGIDTDGEGSADQFKTQVGTSEWALVKSVGITLTARSVGEATDNLANSPNPPRSYDGNPNYVDRRLVRTFTATISLRNSAK